MIPGMSHEGRMLAARRFLTGGEITEADRRLFMTLIRFDPVHVGHFKCNIRRIADDPRLSDYMRTLFRIEVSPRPSISAASSVTTVRATAT
jgi:glutathionyl-hydroquinone reductase